MLDLDAIEARAREALLRVGDCDLDTLDEGTAGDVEEIQELANDIPALVAELRAARVASAYRATASTMHQEIERRNGVERRQGGSQVICLGPPIYGESVECVGDIPELRFVKEKPCPIGRLLSSRSGSR